MIRRLIVVMAALLLLSSCNGGGEIQTHETAVMTESGDAIPE